MVTKESMKIYTIELDVNRDPLEAGAWHIDIIDATCKQNLYDMLNNNINDRHKSR